MNTRTTLGTLLALALLIGCGGDDSGGGAGAAGGAAGAGGRAGTGGKGGMGGGSGSGGMDTYTVGGDVTGLSGSGLVLQNNAGDDLTVSGADFMFSTKLKSGSDYEVTVKTQPSKPAQTCSVTKGKGTVANQDVSDVAVTCTTNEYKVGGNVSGLTGTGLVLSNNGGDDLSVSADGAFTFSTKVKSGADYAVTVKTPPSGQPCTLKDATGKVGSDDVTNVAVTCLSGLVLQAQASFGKVVTSWNDAGAMQYDVYSYSAATCDIAHIDDCTDGKKSSNVKSPYTVTGLTDAKAYYFRVKGSYSGDVNVVSNQTAARPHRPSFNGDISAVATAANGTTYLGGDFSRLTVHTGAAVPLNRVTGFASEIPNAPIVGGDVRAITPDGSGGFFVGGVFNLVDDVRGVLANLIHVKADGTLDSDWKPNPDREVTDLAVLGNTLYVAGGFANIGSVARPGLAAVDMTGAVTSWNPNPAPAGSVQVLAVSGANVLAGGSFTTIGGQTRSGLAALDASGAATPGWDPHPDGDVVALAVLDDTVYAGGLFSNIGGAVRQRLAAIDASGAATAWNPIPDNQVGALAASGSTIYVAGDFTAFIGTGGKPRHRLAAIGTDGKPTAWNPDPKLEGGQPSIFTIAVSGDTVYVAGMFTNVGGADRLGFAAIDAAGVATAWNPNPDGDGAALAVAGDTVYIGGAFDGLGGVSRAGLAAFDSTGAPTDWNPGVKGGNVNAIAVSGDAVYAGGAFTEAGGMARNRLAAFDAMGGVTTWNPNADGIVRTLAPSGGSIYVGGEFGNVGGAARNRAAVLDTNGAAGSWNPNADGTVLAFAFDGATVYVGGSFSTIGGQTRSLIAAVGANGLATGWDANASGGAMANVRSLAFDSAKVYAGGNFTTIGGETRNNLAAIDAGSGQATAWDPNAMAPVNVVGIAEGKLYVGGEFSLIGTTSRDRIAAFAANGDLTTWQPHIEDSVLSFAFTTEEIKVGGPFRRVDDTFNDRFVSLLKSE